MQPHEPSRIRRGERFLASSTGDGPDSGRAAAAVAAPSAGDEGPHRHHARPGDEPELPDLGPDRTGTTRRGTSTPRRSGTRWRPRGGSRRAGGVIHFFAVGQTMEQEDVGWLREIVAQGHPVGNHTYDHVNVKATRRRTSSSASSRAPWLIEGKTPAEVIARQHPPGRAALEAAARDRAGRLPHARAGSPTAWPTAPTSRRCS